MRADYTYWFKGQLKVLRRCAQDVADSMSFHDVKIADSLRQIEFICNQAETEIDRKAGKMPPGYMFSVCPKCEAIVGTVPRDDRLCDRCEE